MRGRPQALDLFGATVQLVDVGRGTQRDLLVGAPGEDRGAGLVHVLPGSPTGVTADGAAAFDQDTPGVVGVPEPGDTFGVLGQD